MPVHHLRPRFEFELPIAAAAAIARLREALAEPGCPCRGLVAELQGHVDLRVHRSEQHLWSPALTLEISERDDGGALIRGLIGPNPAVWTLVAFSTLAFATAAMFLLTFGMVQLGLGESPWGLWLGAACLGMVLAVWAASRLGQRLAAPQTAVLRQFLARCFDAGGG
ncbi:MAG: hypothetical protein H8E31_12965 [Planctomycetes bacterium]|nr:hypothetical protein [Planctomycetota bacterium]